MNHDAWITRPQASLLTGVRPGTIGQWRARGWIGPDGERQHLTTKPGPRGTLLYRAGDILAAERDTRLNPCTPRRMAPAALAV